jgi:hypothetical protein
MYSLKDTGTKGEAALLTPWLSSLGLGLVTPLCARVGPKLIDSMVRRARNDEGESAPRTRWLDPHLAGGTLLNPRAEQGRLSLVNDRSGDIEVCSASAFAPIQRICYRTGWHYGNWLWTLRGWLDLVGGVGMRRGRAHPGALCAGDVTDFCRVEEFDPSGYMRLRAEMKVPGIAWLESKVAETETGSRICQKATFHANPISGRLYWYAIAPLHQFVSSGMLRNMARAGLRGGK